MRRGGPRGNEGSSWALFVSRLSVAAGVITKVESRWTARIADFLPEIAKDFQAAISDMLAAFMHASLPVEIASFMQACACLRGQRARGLLGSGGKALGLPGEGSAVSVG